MKILRLLIAWLSIAGFAPLASALEMFWELLPGRAKDIGVGADGSAWIVGSGVGNGDVFQWNGTGWSAVGGAGVLIAVGPQGDPWVVNISANLFHRVNNQWVLITESGSATSVGVGADGTVLLAGGNSCFCGPVTDQRLYQYTPATGFAELPGDGSAVVIEPDGAGWWVLDSSGRIHRWQGGPNYVLIEGHARDISRGANGDIWIVGGGAFELGNDQLFRWNGAQFEGTTTGQARQISVGPDGMPWVVDDSGRIYRGHYLRLEASDITVSGGAGLRFPVTLSHSSDRVASVNYQVFRPDDSVASSGVLNFAPGVTERVVIHATSADGLPAGVRTYRLQLANAVGADLLRAAATGTVLDPAGGEGTVLTPFLTAGGGFGVRFPSRAGFLYFLQRHDEVGTTTVWSPVTSINGTGNQIELGDSFNPPNRAFYRVKVSPVAP